MLRVRVSNRLDRLRDLIYPEPSQIAQVGKTLVVGERKTHVLSNGVIYHYRVGPNSSLWDERWLDLAPDPVFYSPEILDAVPSDSNLDDLAESPRG